MGSLLLPGALIVYIVGIFLAIGGTVYRSAAARTGSAGALLAAWVLHLAAIVQRGVLEGTLPIGGLAEFLLVLGWAVLTLYLVVWVRFRVHALGLVLPPLAALMTAGAYPWLAPAESGSPSHWLFLLHTSISTAGMAILCVAFAMSLVYLVQDRALKSKRRPGVLERLPSLDRCDRIGHVSLVLGFVLLTLGIATGLVENLERYQYWWSLRAKQVFPLLAWVVFAVILASRTLLGFRGRKSAYLTIAGFTLGLLTMAGMSL